MGCETIVQVFFNMILNIRLYHWSTTSHARHVASGALYDNLSNLSDEFIETYMGRYKRPEYKGPFNIQVKQFNDSNIVDALREYIQFLKYETPKYLKESDTDLLNIRDEMLANINKTQYLFTLN
jgi:hypothetical protein